MLLFLKRFIGLLIASLGFVLISMFTGLPAYAAAPVAPRAGVYDKVTYIEENGDLLGMAVEYKSSPSPVIIVTLCEGGCSGGKPWPVTVKGPNIIFTVYEDFVDQNGRPLPRRPQHYRGLFRANNTLELTIDGQPASRIILRRVLKPNPHEVEQLACQANHC